MIPSRLSDDQVQAYRDDGYLIVRDAIDPQPIDALMAFVAHVVRLESGSTAPDDDVLNRVLIELKRSHPSSSSWIYQTILGSWNLKAFFVGIGIEDLAMQLLDIAAPRDLGVVSPAFRFDIPGDTRNIRTWHQDSAYFLENGPGGEHLVAWIPTTPARIENGSVVLSPASHLNGRQEREHRAAEGFASEQYTIPEHLLAGRPLVHIEADPGDVAFINMDLFHSSGLNVTDDTVRYTAQIRFNTINRTDYRPVNLKPSYPEYTRNPAVHGV